MAMGSRQMVEKRQKQRRSAAPAANTKLSSSSASSIPPLSRTTTTTTVPPGSCPSISSSAANGGGNVHNVLYRDLVDMVPLVESIMDRKRNASFSRRASMVYTPAPAKVINQKGRKPADTNFLKDQSEHADNMHPDLRDNGSAFLASSPQMQTDQDIKNDAEELSALQEQVGSLQKKLIEKEETLTTLEANLKEMIGVKDTLDELKQQIAERDSIVASTNSQLSASKVKLSEKGAALEKLESELMASNGKIEDLQGYLDYMEFEISSFRRLFEELSRTTDSYTDDPFIPAEPSKNYTDFSNEDDSWKMEEARAAYIAAIDAAKENPDEERLSAAAAARDHLCSFLTG